MKSLACVLILSAVTAPTIFSTPVTIAFSGQITSSWQVPEIPVGTFYTGQISYDTNDAPNGGIVGTGAGYTLGGPTEGLIINVGPYIFSSVGTPKTQLGMLVDPTIGYELYLDNSYAPPNGTYTNIPGYSSMVYTAFALQGNSNLFSSAALPTSIDINNLDLAFDQGFVLDFYSQPNELAVSLIGNIETLSVITPEPSAVYLWPLGFFVLGLLFWGRRKLHLE